MIFWKCVPFLESQMPILLRHKCIPFVKRSLQRTLLWLASVGKIWRGVHCSQQPKSVTQGMGDRIALRSPKCPSGSLQTCCFPNRNVQNSVPIQRVENPRNHGSTSTCYLLSPLGHIFIFLSPKQRFHVPQLQQGSSLLPRFILGCWNLLNRSHTKMPTVSLSQCHH